MFKIRLVLAIAAAAFFGTHSAAQQKTATVKVYVYRYKQFIGAALEPSIYCDGRQVARMDNGRYFAVVVDPGKHLFRSNDKQAVIQVDAQPGRDYFIRLELATGFVKGHGRLILVEPEQGMAELSSGKIIPLGADKVKDKDSVTIEQARFAQDGQKQATP